MEKTMTAKIIKNTSQALSYWSIFFLLASVFLLNSCYCYPNEQVIAQPVQNQQNDTAVTQIYFIRKKDSQPNNNRAIIMHAIIGH